MNKSISMAAVAAMLYAATSALAQISSAGPGAAYPAKSIRVIVGFPPGSGPDITARVIGVKLYEATGQQFFVDNRPGAGSNIAADIAAKSAPDGYTLFIGTVANTINATLYPKLPFDFARDFAPVALTTAAPNVLVVHPSVPAKSVKELVALARSRTVTYASSGTGGILHLGAELLCALSGVQMTHVPYKGVAEGYPAVVSGQVNWILGSPISALPLVKAGRLKGIAVTSAVRNKALPDLPTIAESGVPGYEVDAWFGLFAPARVPAPIIEKLHAEAVKALRAPEVVRRMEAEATDVVGNAPREFSAQVGAEYEKWRSLVIKAGLKIQ